MTSHFLCLQPWLVPITQSTQQLLENSLHFYTILCDSSCRLLFQTQPFRTPQPIGHPNPQNPHLIFPHDTTPFPILPSLEDHQDEQGSPEFDLELIIAISKENKSHPPCLLMKLNRELYLANHTTIQELTFPNLMHGSHPVCSSDGIGQSAQQGRDENQQEEDEGRGLYILMRWSTCSLYITVQPKYKSRKIISDKLSSAIIGMNKILKSALPSTQLNLALKKQFQEHHQQIQLKRQQQWAIASLANASNGECSSATVDHDGTISTSPCDHLTHETYTANLIKSTESLVNSQPHSLAVNCVKTAISHWIDFSSLSQYLLQPVLHSHLYHQLLLSPHETFTSITHHPILTSSSQNTPSLLQHRKRAAPQPSPLSPSQTHQSSASLNSPSNKRSKIHISSSQSEIPTLCLLNIPPTVVDPSFPSSPSSSHHSHLHSVMHSFSSSFLTMEESDDLEKTLHDTLQTLEDNILKTFNDHFLTSRGTAAGVGGLLPTTEQNTSNPMLRYSQDLETAFASSYRHLIEDISILRVLPRNDRRPLYPSNSTNLGREILKDDRRA
jgi:hypothetical protein